VLRASLARGKSVIFVLGPFSASCTSSTLRTKVTANPSRPGMATLSVTGYTISHCKINGAPPGISLTSIKALNLPYGVTISSAKGFPVTIAGSSAAKPLALQATISVSSMAPVTCVFTARTVKAHASNTGNTVSAAKQKFTLDATKSNAQCAQAAASATFSATYGPVRDTSVRRSPKVFVR
jgi:hypothetical protein